MAITSVKLAKEQASSQSPNDHSASNTYNVLVDDATTTVAIRNSTDARLPKLGDNHPSDSNMQCTSISVTRMSDTHRGFVYKCDYANSIDEEEEEEDNPLARPPRVTWSGNTSSAPYFIDTDGTPVVTSAGGPFDNMPERDTSSPTCTVIVNRSSFSISNAYEWTNAVNDAPFTISDGRTTWTIAAGVAKMGTITCSDLKLQNGVYYYEVTYPIEFKEGGYDDEFYDRDYYELDDDGNRRQILDSAGMQVKTPWPLDGSGVAKANSSDEPAVLTFKPYNRKTFASLPLR